MSDETLMAGNTPSASPAPTDAPAAAPAPAPAADSAPAAAPTPAAPAATDAPAEKPADASAEAKPADKPAVPEKYEFKAPEGQELNPETLAKLGEYAKKHGMSQEAAQELVDTMAPQMAATMAAQHQAIRTGWQEAARSDKEFGGDKFDANLATAKKALDAFGTPELRTLLESTGLGDNPEVIRFFFKAGQKISSAAFVPAGAGATLGSTKDAAAALYPTLK